MASLSLVPESAADEASFYDGFDSGLVELQENCPHVREIPQSAQIPACLDFLSTKCDEGEGNCPNELEVWLCLACQHSYCGRFSKGHSMAHSRTSGAGHSIVLGLHDLSFWCQTCSAYLNHRGEPVLRNLYQAAHLQKFGHASPEFQ